MEIVLVGLNHHTASLELRERVSFTADQARRAADELRSRGLLEESLVLSTCNRSDAYGVPPPHPATNPLPVFPRASANSIRFAQTLSTVPSIIITLAPPYATSSASPPD